MRIYSWWCLRLIAKTLGFHFVFIFISLRRLGMMYLIVFKDQYRSGEKNIQLHTFYVYFVKFFWLIIENDERNANNKIPRVNGLLARIRLWRIKTISLWRGNESSLRCFFVILTEHFFTNKKRTFHREHFQQLTCVFTLHSWIKFTPI